MAYQDRLVAVAEEFGAEYETDCLLSEWCTYGSGGVADCRISPRDEESFKKVVAALKRENIPFAYIGGGSNLLISDEGFRGAVISTSNLKGLSVKGKVVVAYAGERVCDLVKFLLMSSLGGLEFLNGIPASVGGAVCNNAGCFGKSVSDYLAYAVTVDGVYAAKDCRFAYRDSVFKRCKEGIIKAAFVLDNAEYEQSESKAEYFKNLRRGKHPKGRSCGSVFKNDGYYAGKVVESCGLKGLRIGTARVSEKHGNFIIADQGAHSADIYALIKRVKTTVKEKTGIELKEEIEYLGSFFDEDQF